MPMYRTPSRSMSKPGGRPAGLSESERTAYARQATELLAQVAARPGSPFESELTVAEPALRKVLTGKPSLEARRRAEALLEKLRGPVTSPEHLRALRVVEVLEHVGTPAAREVLTILANGAPGARPTRAAKAALARLARESAASH